MKRPFFALLILGISVVFCAAQTNRKNSLQRALIPAKLHPLMINRLEEFVELQRQQKWTQIFDFLYENQNRAGLGKYNDEQKQCIIELIKANPIINFTYLETNSSTYNLNVPLEKKFWTVYGDGEFSTKSGSSRIRTTLDARYFDQNWFFSLPQYYYDEWFRKTIVGVDLAAEMNEFLEVVEQPDSPVEVFDVSVKMRPPSYVLRDYSFKIRNKTKKTIVSYSYRFIEDGHTVIFANTIKQGDFAVNEGFYGPNHPFCEKKERPVRLFITHVRYSDKTKWHSKLMKY